MRRMDGASAFLLGLERTGAYAHTLKIAILDVNPGEWSFERFRASAARRMHLVPMFRWKALRVPFSLHHPVWVDDPDFDLDYHLRRIACPAPGDRRALCNLVAQVYAWKLDPDKPLWMCWVAEGLEGGKVALITLMHHAYTDGTGVARLLGRLCTTSPQPAEPEVEPWTPEPIPGSLALLGQAAIDLPRTFMRCVPQIAKGIARARRMKTQYVASGKELPPSVKDARDSPLNVLVGHSRTFAFESFDLAYVREISQRSGVTINDVYVATIAAAYRRFMQARGFNPDTGPLVTTIPVSKRPPREEDDCIGNKSSADHLALPVHLSDPIARLRAARHAANVMKQHLKEIDGVDPGNILEIVPPVLLRLIDWQIKRTQGRFSGLWGNAAMSNVAGPTEPLYLGTARIGNWVSIGQISQGMGLVTTAWSYAGHFNVGILADRRLLPDGWEMIGWIREAFEELHRLPTSAAIVAA